MTLKLFRSTGYSSILMAGETRMAMHPGWMILAASLWAGFVANVAVWRAIAGTGRDGGPAHVLLLGALVAGLCAIVLSLLGWRKTLKPAATLLLVLAALAAASIWSQAWPVDHTLLDRAPSSLFLPPWASLLRWQVSAALAGLALAPSVWIWQQSVRRLSGPQQLKVNVTGVLLGLVVAAGASWLLGRGF